jgi:hypothetical protein
MPIDSDVLVWLTRGHVGAAQRLHALNSWRISVVTYIEHGLTLITANV